MSEASKARVFLLRHGETQWSRDGRHTGRTDPSLTAAGREAAKRLARPLSRQRFGLVLSSPLRRARETCELAGLAAKVVLDDDLMEWDYGRYEGLTTPEIQRDVPGWNVFDEGAPGGESPAEVAARVDRVIDRLMEAEGGAGDVAVFAHGHLLRVLAARWVGQPAVFGKHLLLDTGTICVLGHYHGVTRAIGVWNAAVGREG